jgi:hypothetical protein
MFAIYFKYPVMLIEKTTNIRFPFLFKDESNFCKVVAFKRMFTNAGDSLQGKFTGGD